MDTKKRQLILFSIIGVLGIVWLTNKLVFTPFRDRLVALSRDVTLQEAKLSRGYGLIENKEAIESEYKKYAGYFSLLNFSDEETTAVLLKEVEKISRGSGLAILDMKPQKEAASDKFSKQYQINIRAEADLKQLVDFLYELYNSTVLFSVEKMVLVPKSEEAATLNITMTVVGVAFL